MKRTILIGMIFLFTIALQGFAQQKEKRTPEERAAKQTEMMTKELGLTESQASRIKVINLEAAQRMESLRAANETDKKKIIEQKKAINTDRLNSLKAVLNAEQIAKYEEIKAQKKTKSKTRHKSKAKQAK